MTIEEVRALIATPMKNEAVKQAYLFSCFCGLRISDIISLKWKDVFVDRGQYRLAVSMQKTKEPIYLPLSPEALKWMPERREKTSEDHVFDLPSPTMVNTFLKPWAKAAGIDKRFTLLPPHVRDDDADARCRPLHHLETTRSFGYDNTIRGKFFLLPLVGYLLNTDRHRQNPRYAQSNLPVCLPLYNQLDIGQSQHLCLQIAWQLSQR